MANSLITRGHLRCPALVDCAGNLYASGGIFSADGQRLGDYGPGTNLAFGGPEGKTVLVAGPGSQVRELQMNIPGLP